jgi:PPM family protein phosphatase
MTLVWRYAARSDVGLHREINEDSVYAGPRLIAVADGMGGHAAGEVASAATIAALTPLDTRDSDSPEEALRRALVSANTTLRDMVRADPELQGMGTTLTAALADGDRMVLAHIGDSRAYLLRDGELQQLTQDHTYVQQLVDAGKLDPADAGSHPQRNYILRALDGRSSIEPDVTQLDVRAGDRFLICSDGLSGVVSDDTLREQLGSGTVDQAAERLLDLALRGGAPDNVTVVVADVADSDEGAPPVVGGAADDLKALDAERVLRERPSSAEATPAADAARVATADASGDRLQRNRTLRRRRSAVVALAVLVLLGVGTAVGWSYLRNQYYVGVDGDRVAIFRGVEGTFLGRDLSSVAERTDLTLDMLPSFVRRDLENGIGADDLAEARRIVDRLAPSTPEPTPTPGPTSPGSPTASPLPTAPGMPT